MRLIKKFGLVFDGDEPIAINLAVKTDDAEFETTFAFPDECLVEGENGEDPPLAVYVQNMWAAQDIEFPDETSESWFTDWFFVDETLLDSRMEAAAPPVAEELVSSFSEVDPLSEAIQGEELSGDLTGSGGEVSEASELSTTPKSRKVVKREKLRKGSGCKQPDAVNGFMAGRLLCVTKNHRSHGIRPFGRCEYRVRCEENGSYTLEYFAGNRKDIKQGDNWKTASDMFFALMAMPKGDTRANSTMTKSRHHRMTIKRFFKL